LRLTDAKIRTAKTRANRYRIADSNGLAVEISPTGSRYWRYRYKLNGKENLFAAGQWCQPPLGESAEQAEARRNAGDLTLAEARAARMTWRAQVKNGQHPRLVRRAARLASAETMSNTFEALAREYMERRGKEWSQAHRRRVAAFLEGDAIPDLGPLPISTITPAQILAVLQRVEERGAISVAVIGRGYISQVFRFAIASQKATIDPVPSLRGALLSPGRKHHTPLGRSDVKPFLQAVSGARANRQTEIAVRLLLLTMTRTVELRCAPWAEFDLDRAEWRVPAERMKQRRPHIVPLSRQAMDLLQELHGITGRGPLLFPSIRKSREPMSPAAIDKVFRRAGYGGRFSPHSFRGTAATLLREAGFDSRLVELQLAHTDRNASRASYDHADLLPQRRAMLQEWADMVDQMNA